MREKPYLIRITWIPEPHRIMAATKAQARYRSWRAAVEAGYRISLVKFMTEWVDSVEEATP